MDIQTILFIILFSVVGFCRCMFSSDVHRAKQLAGMLVTD